MSGRAQIRHYSPALSELSICVHLLHHPIVHWSHIISQFQVTAAHSS